MTVGPTSGHRRGPRRLVLGIETSCDETAASVVEDSRRVRSNIIASQHDLHAEYRGVVPEIASRAHAERITPVVRGALEAAGVSLTEIELIAVGNRPGLIGSLLVGVAAAKGLALSLGIPFIAVDHVHAHLYAGLLGRDCDPAPLRPVEELFPALGLVISGGHTSLYLCQSPTRCTRIAGTIDDAIGEAYDKVAAILGLPFPGGPSLDRLAAAHAAAALEPDRDGFPIARIAPDSLDFSFSGLKTAALYAYRGVPESRRVKDKRLARGEPDPVTRPAAQVAATFQRAAVATIVLKLGRALERYPHCRALLVGGGVSANSLLRSELERLAAERRLPVVLPALEYCLDNAAMIAGLGSALWLERDRIGDPWSTGAVPTTGS